MTKDILIRTAQLEDSSAIAQLYNPYIRDTNVTFEEADVTEQDIQQRMQAVDETGFFWLVAEHQGELAGYAYATAWRPRHAYRFSVEVTAYVSPAYQGKGVGSRLYDELLPSLKKQGIHSAMGGIALPNDASVALKTDRIRTFTQANKAAWEASAHLHGQGKGWDELLLAASQPGFNVLDSCLTATLTELGIAGRNAVQISFNNARELLSLAAFGAQPKLGLDQSAAFLAQGAKLAAASGLNPHLVEADIYDLPDDLGRYDLALITIGVLNWMPDLQRLFQVVRGLMKPRAFLVIYETHPVLEMFNPDSAQPFVPEISYFEKTPVRLEEAITYDGSDGGVGETSYWFIHTLGQIVTACVQNDFKLQRLEEHPHLNREVDYEVYENQTTQIPLCYSLVAEAY